MDIVTYSAARRNLSAVMDKAAADRAPVMISRRGAVGIVLVSESEWAGMMRIMQPIASATDVDATVMVEHGSVSD